MFKTQTTGTGRHHAEQRVDRTSGDTTCPDCGTVDTVFDPSRAECCCANCGMVLEDQVVDYGPEWRAYDEQDRNEKSRVGAPTTAVLHDRGLTTTIDWRNQDAQGQTLPSERRRRLERLREWQKWIRVRDASERNLRYALSEINRMASALDIPRSIRSRAAVVYRRALREDLIKGRSIESMATAALYVTCRDDGLPRSLGEFAEVARVDKSDIGRAYRFLVAELELEVIPVDPGSYVPRFCSALGLSEAVTQDAIAICEEMTGRGIHSGKSPTGFAGASVYLAAKRAGEERSQRDVADVAGVTDVTIRKHYREQQELLDADAPDVGDPEPA